MERWKSYPVRTKCLRFHRHTILLYIRQPAWIYKARCTLNASGILFVNRCTWAHVLVEVARDVGLPREEPSNSGLRGMESHRIPDGIELQHSGGGPYGSKPDIDGDMAGTKPAGDD